jgi:hypothetical protein
MKSFDMKFRSGLLIMPLLVILLAGCPDIETLPDTPRIEFESFTLSEKTDDLGNQIILGELVFLFEDGDGDIGMPEPDSVAQNDSSQYNLFMTMYKKIDMQYIEVGKDELGAPLFYRIPYIEPREGQNKTLQGNIKIDFEYLTLDYDTIRYDFYMYDRARNKSNTESTTDISFTEWKSKN